ncbi:hypothetical protein NH340_JMT05786 [Sarcoptes scabiei]|uniref:Uncharacterized protein n=1 Tax=Sarcoptes scabiei TaxID=52283 RepID=A0A132A7E2_SARSC|nr:hypothetical protein QR98_0053770 [Sarcoptes scabiei]UXI19843.1 hypothetical protein NH340_JMT05786 [Sarcoptes scabiei]
MSKLKVINFVHSLNESHFDDPETYPFDFVEYLRKSKFGQQFLMNYAILLILILSLAIWIFCCVIQKILRQNLGKNNRYGSYSPAFVVETKC